MSKYEVFEHIGDEGLDEESHGTFDSLDEARGCVEFDRLTSYSIWRGSELIESSYPQDNNVAYNAGYAYAAGYHD